MNYRDRNSCEEGYSVVIGAEKERIGLHAISWGEREARRAEQNLKKELDERMVRTAIEQKQCMKKQSKSVSPGK